MDTAVQGSTIGSDTPQQARHLHFKLGPSAFIATLLGSEHGHDWSLSLLGDPDRREEYQARLDRVLYNPDGDIHIVDATQFNTELLHPGDFTIVKSLGKHRYLQARDRPAEGLFLKPGAAAFQSPAGCLTVAAARYNSFDSRKILPVKAHAGRWSLVRKRTVLRKHESVCHSILEGMSVDMPYEAKDVWIKLLWGIRKEDFPHPLRDSEHAGDNLWLWHYLVKNGWDKGSVAEDGVAYLDLAMIAKAQFMQRGVPEHQINLDDAYLPAPAVYKDGRRGQPRNGVFVKHLI